MRISWDGKKKSEDKGAKKSAVFELVALKPSELCSLYLQLAAVYIYPHLLPDLPPPPSRPPNSPRIKQKGWTAPWKRLREKTGMMRRGKRTKAITRGGESGARKTNGEMIKCSFLLIPHFSKGAKKIALSSSLQVKTRTLDNIEW